jgi:hypothetical protein
MLTPETLWNRYCFLKLTWTFAFWRRPDLTLSLPPAAHYTSAHKILLLYRTDFHLVKPFIIWRSCEVNKGTLVAWEAGLLHCIWIMWRTGVSKLLFLRIHFVCRNWVSNLVKQSPWKANSRSVSQITCLLWAHKGHHCFYESRQLNTVLSRINSVDILTSTFFIRSILMLFYLRLGLRNGLSLSGFLTKISYEFLTCLCFNNSNKSTYINGEIK